LVGNRTAPDLADESQERLLYEVVGDIVIADSGACERLDAAGIGAKGLLDDRFDRDRERHGVGSRDRRGHDRGVDRFDVRRQDVRVWVSFIRRRLIRATPLGPRPEHPTG